MENSTLHGTSIKKKQRKRALCYFAVTVMIILLLMPPIFRLFVADRNAGIVKEVDIIMVLNCNTSTESITSTFLNGKPGTLTYKIRGNYVLNTTQNNPDEAINNNLNESDQALNDSNTLTTTNDSNSLEEKNEQNMPSSSPLVTAQPTFNPNNNILEIISKHGQFEYDSVEDASFIKINVLNLVGIPEYEAIFSTLENQQSYYNLQGFTCSATQIE